jgi:hypothetical protein
MLMTMKEKRRAIVAVLAVFLPLSSALNAMNIDCCLGDNAAPGRQGVEHRDHQTHQGRTNGGDDGRDHSCDCGCEAWCLTTGSHVLALKDSSRRDFPPVPASVTGIGVARYLGPPLPPPYRPPIPG